MGLSVVHGRILIEYGKGKKSRNYIKSIGEDDYYPFISTNMFSNVAEPHPPFYDQQVIGFAATYKNVEYGYGFHAFILKFEKILRELEFETAHIELETELIGTYRFFWKKIGKLDTIKDLYQNDDFKLIRTNEWYFGFGYRSDYGSLNVELKEEQIFTYDDFTYPVTIPEKVLSDFKSLLAGLKNQEIGTKFYLNKYVKNQFSSSKSEGLGLCLDNLQIEGKINFEFEDRKGYSITKIQEI